MPRKRKATPAAQQQLYRLTGADEFSEDFRAASDSMALARASSILMFDERQRVFRDGVVVPFGDYLLSLVGGKMDEPYMLFRKHDDGKTVLSWRPA